MYDMKRKFFQQAADRPDERTSFFVQQKRQKTGSVFRFSVLYGAALRQSVCFYGAGEGNRTLVTSLEGWHSTIELHPHVGIGRSSRI